MPPPRSTMSTPIRGRGRDLAESVRKKRTKVGQARAEQSGLLKDRWNPDARLRDQSTRGYDLMCQHRIRSQHDCNCWDTATLLQTGFLLVHFPHSFSHPSFRRTRHFPRKEWKWNIRLEAFNKMPLAGKTAHGESDTWALPRLRWWPTRSTWIASSQKVGHRVAKKALDSYFSQAVFENLLV